MKIKVLIKKAVEKVKDLVCPPATQDLELNTKNRNAAIEAEHIQYGPLNLADEEYWNKAAKHWKTTADVAKKSKCSNCVAFDISPRMKECMPGSVQEDGELGYCWMHHFKCHSARTCYTWAAGGPISDDKTSTEWQEKNKESLQEEDEQYGAGRIKKKKKHAKQLGIDLEEEKICPKGKAWAMRKYGKWSAYAAMGASKYCKDPNYGKGKKKNEEIEEGELKKWRDENWVQSDGTPCGDAKAQKNPKRCKPKSKWATMSKSEKSADDTKKKEGGKKGKQFVSATKKGKVTKSHTKEQQVKITKSRLEQIIKEEIENIIFEDEEFYEVDALNEDEEYCPVCRETQELKEKKKKPCKPSKGKRFAKRVDGKCRSYGQAGQAKGGGDRIRPGTKKGDAYCARSAGIKKCKNPPCANTLSRKKWKCRGKKSMRS